MLLRSTALVLLFSVSRGPLLVAQEDSEVLQAHDRPAPLVMLERQGVVPLARVGTVLLAGQPTRGALTVLSREGVRSVVDLRDAGEARGFDEPGHVTGLGLGYACLPVRNAASLTDELFAEVRRLLARQREDPDAAPLLLHGASAERAAVVWLPARVLDEQVAWEAALAEARRLGLRSGELEEVARHYVLGAGKQELGRWKERIRAELPGVKGIGVDELALVLAGEGPQPLLLDVRKPSEFAVSHLRGAQLAPDLARALALLEQGPRQREVVLYCSIGYRSARLASLLGERGFTNVRNLEGSIFEWANTGHAVFRNEEPVREVHPYDRKWGRLLDRELWSWDAAER